MREVAVRQDRLGLVVPKSTIHMQYFWFHLNFSKRQPVSQESTGAEQKAYSEGREQDLLGCRNWIFQVPSGCTCTSFEMMSIVFASSSPIRLDNTARMRGVIPLITHDQNHISGREECRSRKEITSLIFWASLLAYGGREMIRYLDTMIIGTPFSLHHLKKGLNPGSSLMSTVEVIRKFSENEKTRTAVEDIWEPQHTLLKHLLALLKRCFNTLEHIAERVPERHPPFEDFDIQVPSVCRSAAVYDGLRSNG